MAVTDLDLPELRRVNVAVPQPGIIQHQIYLERFTAGPTPRTQLLHFPVNPEQFQIQHRRDINDVSLLRLGTLSRPGSLQPIELSFSAFFPALMTPEGTSWLNIPASELNDPWALRSLVRAWQAADDQVTDEIPASLRLSISDTAGFSIWCAISGFDCETRPRELGDLYYSITFREVAVLPNIAKGKTASKVKARPTRVVNSRYHIAQEGDTLAKIARLRYGESSATLIVGLWKAQSSDFRDKLKGNRNAKIPAKTKVVTPPEKNLVSKD